MEVLRVPPYPITTTWDLPIPNYEYIVYLEDLVDHSVEETNLFSDASGKLLYELPLEKVQYDRDFFIKFYDTEHEHTLYESNLTITRPYINPTEFGTTASEIAEYKMYELIARSMIDTYVGDGFYNHKLVINTTGQGADYLSLWHDTNKILKVYENNVLVFDSDSPDDYEYEYKLLLDNSGIYRVDKSMYQERINRFESSPSRVIVGRGDIGFIGNFASDFPVGFDYTIILDVGYKAVPADVEVATRMLIEDIKCGKLDYYKRYISSYNTDQFRIQFDKSINSGTGNMLVDKILDKYVKLITKPGVL
ncbi:MAG: hypothetical protein EBV27_00180 [Actinobacteria bacterium]|jgi:hypothetical protein|nr:hypothetical protein [Actinomycetota bacterium]